LARARNQIRRQPPTTRTTPQELLTVTDLLTHETSPTS
jgi:hypothetical protein